MKIDAVRQQNKTFILKGFWPVHFHFMLAASPVSEGHKYPIFLISAQNLFNFVKFVLEK